MSDYFDEMGWMPLQDGAAPNSLLQLAQFLRDSGMWNMSDILDQKLPPPAAKAAIDALEEIKIVNFDSKHCPVCLKPFELNEVAKRLPCCHMFHKECIFPWLQKTNSCPLCRYELPTDDEDYEMYKKEKLRAVEREKDLEALHNSMFG